MLIIYFNIRKHPPGPIKKSNDPRYHLTGISCKDRYFKEVVASDSGVAKEQQGGKERKASGQAELVSGNCAWGLVARI